MIRRTHIGEELRAVRKMKGWSHENLALDAGLNVSTVSTCESNGPNKMTTFLKLCKALDVLPSTILKRAESQA